MVCCPNKISICGRQTSMMTTAPLPPSPIPAVISSSGIYTLCDSLPLRLHLVTCFSLIDSSKKMECDFGDVIIKDCLQSGWCSLPCLSSLCWIFTHLLNSWETRASLAPASTATFFSHPVIGCSHKMIIHTFARSESDAQPPGVQARHNKLVTVDSLNYLSQLCGQE